MSVLALMASGSGTNVAAILAAHAAGEIPGTIACVACDRPGAPVLERARAAGVEALAYDVPAFGSREVYERTLVGDLAARGVTHVVLAGYMRICGDVFLGAFAGQAINVHPSLLPAFPGIDAIGRALASGAEETGVTVHFIDHGVDTGPAICQSVVPVRAGDTLESLSPRIHTVEHAVLPAVTAALLDGGVVLDAQRRVILAEDHARRLQTLGAEPAPGCLVVPGAASLTPSHTTPVLEVPTP